MAQRLIVRHQQRRCPFRLHSPERLGHDPDLLDQL